MLRRSRVERARRSRRATRSTLPASSSVERAAQLRPLGLRPARHFAKHFFRAGGAELLQLGVNVLAVRRDSCIPQNHEAILQQIYATEKRNRIKA